jgi:hypothetical protein
VEQSFASQLISDQEPGDLSQSDSDLLPNPIIASAFPAAISAGTNFQIGFRVYKTGIASAVHL